jgi:F-type H+-transporting ATPase subunit delta
MADRARLLSIARRYAHAVFELLDSKARETLATECQGFVDAVEQDVDIAKFLRNMVFPVEMKAKVLLQVFPQSRENKVFSNFIEMITSRRREEMLPAFCEVFQERVDNEAGRARCVVTVARPVSEKTLNNVIETISKKVKKNLIIKTKTDPKLLGGFRAEVNGMVVDGSLRTQLDRLRDQIVSSVN